MEPEVRFASLSRVPEFPIAVPYVQFADYQHRSGTRMLITERIRYGDKGIERHYHKCLDYEMPEPLDHYRALLTALARLAGTHRSGCLPAGLTSRFPLDVAAATVGDRAPLSPDKLAHQNSWHACAKTCRGSRTTNTRSQVNWPPIPTMLRCATGTPTSTTPGSGGRAGDDVLHCGLMDWGCVGQMNMGMAIWGAMSGAETDMCGTAISTNCCTCSSPKSIAAAVRTSIRIGCAGTHCSTPP